MNIPYVGVIVAPPSGQCVSQFQISLQFSSSSSSYTTSGLCVRRTPGVGGRGPGEGAGGEGAGGEGERLVWHLQYTGWPDHGCPEDAADFLGNTSPRTTVTASPKPHPTLPHPSIIQRYLTTSPHATSPYAASPQPHPTLPHSTLSLHYLIPTLSHTTSPHLIPTLPHPNLIPRYLTPPYPTLPYPNSILRRRRFWFSKLKRWPDLYWLGTGH